MTVAPIAGDMVVLAQSMDRFGIESHLRRVEAILEILEDRRHAAVATTGLDTGYPKPRHTTAFGDPSIIVECSQTRGLDGVPMRSVRTYGAPHLYHAEYGETDTTDPSDVLGHSSIDCAIALASRFRDMLSRALPARERNPHCGDASVIAGLAAYLQQAGIDAPRGEFTFVTGRPYGLPKVMLRDRRGDFHPMDGVDAVELDLWMPPCASFQHDGRSSFRRAWITSRGDATDWRVDAMEMLRLARRRKNQCSG